MLPQQVIVNEDLMLSLSKLELLCQFLAGLGKLRIDVGEVHRLHHVDCGLESVFTCLVEQVGIDQFELLVANILARHATRRCQTCQALLQRVALVQIPVVLVMILV